MVINDNKKYFLKNPIQKSTKNKLKIRNTGYASPENAMGQNSSGEI